MVSALKAPFPWFGGKSRAADIIWPRLGDTPNYVEPFAGSLAILLRRPYPAKIETVNDIDCYIACFWRALQADPDGVADWCDAPVNEADLHARHLWLVNRTEFREQMKTDPDFYDVKIAGWWVWGLSCWIASGWCMAANQASDHVHQKMPHLSSRGHGIHRKMPDIGSGSKGVHRSMGNEDRREGLIAYFHELAARLRHVRVNCGSWDRILGPSVTVKHGVTAVFLDPPYSLEADRKANLYSQDDLQVAHRVREWAIENGENPSLRICLAGYEGEHSMPDDWEVVEWKAMGGYGGQRQDEVNENSIRERLWFSPHCLKIGSSQAKQATFVDIFPDAAEHING